MLIATAALCAAAGAGAATYKWVDDQGRIQYSDRPPPASKGSQEMNRRGIVTKKTDAELTPEQRKAAEEDVARKKAEEQKLAEQKRLDLALMQSYTSEKEIDQKRDRDVQVIRAQIDNMQRSLKAAKERAAENQSRIDAQAKTKKPVSDQLKQDQERTLAEQKSLEQQIADKEREVVATREKYDAFRKRFVELKQGGAVPIEPVKGPEPPVKGASAKR